MEGLGLLSVTSMSLNQRPKTPKDAPKPVTVKKPPRRQSSVPKLPKIPSNRASSVPRQRQRADSMTTCYLPPTRARASSTIAGRSTAPAPAATSRTSRLTVDTKPDARPRPRRARVPIRVPWSSADHLQLQGEVVDGNEGVRWYTMKSDADAEETPRAATARNVQLFDSSSCRSTVDAKAQQQIRARYVKLNRLESTDKIFSLLGPYQDLKTELLGRGWIENKDARENLVADLILTVRSNVFKPENLPPNVFYNHFGGSNALTTKVGIGQNVRNLHWFSPEDHRAIFPAAYDLDDPVDLQLFKEHHGVFSALSVLHRVLAGHPVEGTLVPLAARAMECIAAEHSHADLNTGHYSPSEEEWQILSNFSSKSAVTSSYEMISDDRERFTMLIDEYTKLNPAATLTNGHNAWICKPAGKSRGRGICCMDNISEILSLTGAEAHYVTQKYIERPLLIKNRKFDCRVWVLVTSYSPLIVYIYDDYYLRFCCHDFTLTNLDDTYIHLANNSIQKHSKNFDNIVPPDDEEADTEAGAGGVSVCMQDADLESIDSATVDSDSLSSEAPSSPSTDTDPDPTPCPNPPSVDPIPEPAKPPRAPTLKKTERANNMWRSSSFETYITKEFGAGRYEEMMVAMRRAIVSVLMTGQGHVKHRKGSYELYGFDVVFDEALSPWILEVNASPTLEHSSYITAELVPRAMSGLIAVLLDVNDTKVRPTRSGWVLKGAGRIGGEGDLPASIGSWRNVYRARHPGKVGEGGGLELAGTEIAPPKIMPAPLM